MEIIIKSLEVQHWSEVARIYQLGIQTNKATFETILPTYDSWNAGHITSCRLVALLKGEIRGWAALSQVSNREVYKCVAEVSVYVDLKYSGKGIGAALLSTLIEESETNGFWTLQASIFPENEASLYLHEKLGFRRIGVRKNIAQLNDNWRDNVILERRSKKF